MAKSHYANTDRGLGQIYSLLDDPPDVFDGQGSFNQKRHDEVLGYAEAVFANIARDETLSVWQRQCPTRTRFYKASQSKTPDEIDLSKRSVNLCKIAIDFKVARLMNDRLTLHVSATQGTPQNHDVAQAIQRWWDWHERETNRRRLQHKIEKMAPIFGMGGAILTPKYDYSTQEIIPAYGKRLLPWNMFFRTSEEDIDDCSVFVVREVVQGYLQDQKYSKMLAKRFKKKEDRRFERGSHTTLAYQYAYTTPTVQLLESVGDGDVEILRMWIRDYTTIPLKVYYTDTAEAVEARTQANDELAKDEQGKPAEDILHDARLPKEGENHYNHYLQHMEQVKFMKAAREAGETIPEDYFLNLKIHMDATEEMLSRMEPDEKREQLKYKGGWRYIKMIGQQVIRDGSSDLEYNQRPPVALFRNNLDPGEINIGISDMDALMNLNRDLNNLINDKMEHSFRQAFGQKYMPHSLRNTETNKPGEIIYLKDPKEKEMMGWIAPPPRSKDGDEAIGMLMQFIEMIGGANQTVQGDVPRSRTSGVGIDQLQSAAAQRYVATQELLTDGWEDFASIGLAQMKQFMTDEMWLDIAGPEYQEAVQLTKDMIDPSAKLRIERVPRDYDFQRQRGQELLQMAQIGVTVFGISPKMVLKTLAAATDAGAVGEIYGRFMESINQNPEAGQMMDQAYQNQVASSAPEVGAQNK